MMKEEIYLIDILRINDFSILDDLMSQSQTKNFHSQRGFGQFTRWFKYCKVFTILN